MMKRRPCGLQRGSSLSAKISWLVRIPPMHTAMFPVTLTRHRNIAGHLDGGIPFFGCSCSSRLASTLQDVLCLCMLCTTSPHAAHASLPRPRSDDPVHNRHGRTVCSHYPEPEPLSAACAVTGAPVRESSHTGSGSQVPEGRLTMTGSTFDITAQCGQARVGR
jgi:hypothetical protein